MISSQPHHTLQKPVFIQKIVPFAATRVENSAIFSSVSSSWQETMREYGGSILCLKAFTQASPKNRNLIFIRLASCFDFRASEPTKTQRDMTNAEINVRRDMIAALKLVPLSDAKDVLDNVFSRRSGADDSALPLLTHVFEDPSISMEDVQPLFELFKAIDGDKNNHDNNDDLFKRQFAAVHFVRLNQPMTKRLLITAVKNSDKIPPDVFKYLINTMHTHFSAKFLKVQFELTLRSQANILETVLESFSPPSVVSIIFDALQAVGGGDEYVYERIVDCSNIGQAFAWGSLPACRMMCQRIETSKGRGGLKDFIVNKLKKNLLLAICSNIHSENSQEERIKFVLELFRETMQGQEFIRGQLETQDSQKATPFMHVCTKSDSVTLVQYFLDLFKNVSSSSTLNNNEDDEDDNSSYLKEMMSMKTNWGETAFAVAIKAAKMDVVNRQRSNAIAIVKLLASELAHCEILEQQVERLEGGQREFLKRHGIEVNVSSLSRRVFTKEEIDDL